MTVVARELHFIATHPATLAQPLRRCRQAVLRHLYSIKVNLTETIKLPESLQAVALVELAELFAHYVRRQWNVDALVCDDLLALAAQFQLEELLDLRFERLAGRTID